MNTSSSPVRCITVAAIVLGCMFAARATDAQSDPLPSWNDTPTKKAITDFVAKVTKEGSPDFVPPAERIAVFDNDGTLWPEQPMYFQVLFAIDRIKAMAAQGEHPEWKDKEPFKSLIAGDTKAALASGEHATAEIMTTAHSGMSTDEFQNIVKQWLATARHPVTKRPYTEMVYQPMLEVLAYLRASGFKTFIVSGGGVEFIRAFAEETYGIPPEQVVGSSGVVTFEMKDGKPVLTKQPKVEFIDDGPGKPVGINRFIGRRPIMAFGNSDGDLQMLQYTSAGEGARFGLIVHHTDAEREFAYDRTSHIGKLDKALDEAGQRGWTVVNMKNDWKTIFPAAATRSSSRSALDASAATPLGMVWIAGGEFTMGTDDPNAMHNERPAHRVKLDGFWMDQTAVTNAQFRAFVDATGYITTAERPVDWEELKKQTPPGTPKPPEEMLKPGSLVFTPPDHAVDLRDMSQWWSWTTGADWKHPAGPDSNIEGKDEWPVVQVSWDDAIAYAKWAGKRLPTEAEWEFAARGGLESKRYPWGDEFIPATGALAGKHMANTFDGEFPYNNTKDDGFADIAPVKSFPPNGYGLYDMAGNVWNWTADLYRADAHALSQKVANESTTGCCANPRGPLTSFDPGRELPDSPQRVIKGGSFMCNPSYCESYRPSARRGTPPDTGTQHTGFRCVKDDKP